MNGLDKLTPAHHRSVHHNRRSNAPDVGADRLARMAPSPARSPLLGPLACFVLTYASESSYV